MQNNIDREKVMTFAMAEINDGGPPLLLIGIPAGAWNVMKNGLAQDVDLTSVGYPVRIAVFGAKTHQDLMNAINGVNNGLGNAQDMRDKDFSLEANSLKRDRQHDRHDDKKGGHNFGHLIEELSKKMSQWKDDLDTQIAKIHADGGVTNEQVTADVNEAVATATKPLQDSITEIQSALSDIVTHLENGDTAAAQSAVTQAQTIATDAGVTEDAKPDTTDQGS